jgi:hypothetical protein
MLSITALGGYGTFALKTSGSAPHAVVDTRHAVRNPTAIPINRISKLNLPDFCSSRFSLVTVFSDHPAIPTGGLASRASSILSP